MDIELTLSEQEQQVARKILEAAAQWFQKNDPDGEKFFPAFYLKKMADNVSPTGFTDPQTFV